MVIDSVSLTDRLFEVQAQRDAAELKIKELASAKEKDDGPADGKIRRPRALARMTRNEVRRLLNMEGPAHYEEWLDVQVSLYFPNNLFYKLL